MVGALWDNGGCVTVLGARPPLSPAPARQGWKGAAIWSGWRVVALAREIARCVTVWDRVAAAQHVS